PASWQGEHHFLKATSVCANALPAETTTSNEANVQVFMSISSTSSQRRRPCERVMPVGTAALRRSTGVRMAFGANPVNAPGVEFAASGVASIEAVRLRL